MKNTIIAVYCSTTISVVVGVFITTALLGNPDINKALLLGLVWPLYIIYLIVR